MLLKRKLEIFFSNRERVLFHKSERGNNTLKTKAIFNIYKNLPVGHFPPTSYIMSDPIDISGIFVMKR